MFFLKWHCWRRFAGIYEEFPICAKVCRIAHAQCETASIFTFYLMDLVLNLKGCFRALLVDLCVANFARDVAKVVAQVAYKFAAVAKSWRKTKTTRRVGSNQRSISSPMFWRNPRGEFQTTNVRIISRRWCGAGVNFGAFRWLLRWAVWFGVAGEASQGGCHKHS